MQTCHWCLFKFELAGSHINLSALSHAIGILLKLLVALVVMFISYDRPVLLKLLSLLALCNCSVLVFTSVGTGFLWWTFYGEYKQRTESNHIEEFRVPLTSIDMESEKAFLILSIVASVLTVSDDCFSA